MKTPEALTHESLMPFGKHKDKTMLAVPPDYLIWLYENDKCFGSVKKYIEDNMLSLERRVTRKLLVKMYNYAGFKRRTG